MNDELLFLGTGASMGIPVIGCKCHVCTSSSSFNKRLRPSALIKQSRYNYLIDVGPDFRTQALKYQIHHLDGVLLTHTHYDHIAGLDDLRIFSFRKKKPVPCLVSRETLEELKVRYHYIMPPQGYNEDYTAKFDFQILKDDAGETEFEGLSLSYFSYFQKGMKVTGFRFKNLAYIVDILEYGEDIFDHLQDLDILVIDGIAWERTVAHLTIPDVITFAKKTGAKRIYLTHIAHETDHEKTNQKLPQGFELAYDGLKVTIS